MSEAAPLDGGSAPPPSPAPDAGPTIIAPSFVGAWGHTAIIPLWVPVVVFAHAFAAFWLFKTWMLNSPALQRRMRANARAINRFTRTATLRVRGSLGGRTSLDGKGGRLSIDDTTAAGGNADQVNIQVSSQDASPFQEGGKQDEDSDDVREETADEVSLVWERRGGCIVGDTHLVAVQLLELVQEPAGGQLPRSDTPPLPQTAPLYPTPHQVFKALDGNRTSLPHTFSVNVAPSTLEWQGIGCSYNTPTGVKEVLAGVWGIAQPGEMQALLGPSGAGKSTFMDILALRKSIGNLSGRLLVNGARASKKFIKKTAYVPQDDNFVPTMTTWEVMSFYADVSSNVFIFSKEGLCCVSYRRYR
jgi:ABC-type multidrug transport system fused ATPase/permease subunit